MPIVAQRAAGASRRCLVSAGAELRDMVAAGLELAAERLAERETDDVARSLAWKQREQSFPPF